MLRGIRWSITSIWIPCRSPPFRLSTGQVYFLHNDRLGAPQIATDSSQNRSLVRQLRTRLVR